MRGDSQMTLLLISDRIHRDGNKKRVNEIALYSFFGIMLKRVHLVLMQPKYQHIRTILLVCFFFILFYFRKCGIIQGLIFVNYTIKEEIKDG